MQRRLGKLRDLCACEIRPAKHGDGDCCRRVRRLEPSLVETACLGKEDRRQPEIASEFWEHKA
jgi:hypothetical protein